MELSLARIGAVVEFPSGWPIRAWLLNIPSAVFPRKGGRAAAIRPGCGNAGDGKGRHAVNEVKRGRSMGEKVNRRRLPQGERRNEGGVFFCPAGIATIVK